MKFEEIEYGYQHEVEYNLLRSGTDIIESRDRIMAIIREAYNLGKEEGSK